MRFCACFRIGNGKSSPAGLGHLAGVRKKHVPISHIFLDVWRGLMAD